MKKKLKVWAATVMTAAVLGLGSISAYAAPAVTPSTDSKSYIFDRYEEKRAGGASEAELAKARPVKQTFYNSKGVQGTTEEYRYDSQGRLSEMFTIYGKETTPAYRTVYDYDGQGNLIKETEYIYPENTVYRECSYDGRGNMTKWVDYRDDGSVYHQADFSFVYDKQGKPLEYKSKEITGSSSTLKYSYDGQGKLIGKVGYTNGKLDLNMGYRYDAAGRLIEVVKSFVVGEVLDFPEAEYCLQMTYAYDAAGRLIKISGADCIYNESGSMVKEARTDGSRIEYFYN
ncbi:MAG: hypothetical protein NC400_08245 [Clostridium sp.]|nr:hypothetical protein [Clostridium sp.]